MTATEGLSMLFNNSHRIVVHFGLPKTGSTSIQESLFRYLNDPRFHYVSFSNPKTSLVIATGFKDDPARFGAHARRGTSSDELQRLRKQAVDSLEAELQAAGGRTAILSSEAISSFHMQEIRNLCSFITKHRPAATAVAYVRRPKEYMESVFQQRVKGGVQRFRAPSLLPNFRARFEHFDAVLGRQNVGLWLFDPASFPGHCVVQDFCSRLGITFRPEDAVRANEGLSLPALSLLFAYRKFGPGYGVGPTVPLENSLLVTKIRALPGPRLRLHSSVVAPVIKARRKGIEWMEERLGASLAEDLTLHDRDAIRSEDELLRFTPEALRWLAEELGDGYVRRWHPEMDPREVAEWMHLLRLKLAAADKRVQRDAVPKSPVRKMFNHIRRRALRMAWGLVRVKEDPRRETPVKRTASPAAKSSVE